MICFNKDLTSTLKEDHLQDHQVDNDYDYTRFLQLLDDACSQLDPTKARELLKHGIEFTKMSAAELSDYASSIGLEFLAEEYRGYR